VLKDLELTKNAVFISLIIGMFYAVAFIYVMSRFARCLAIMSLLMIELFLVIFAGAALYLRKDFEGEPSKQ
jgi:ABC-type bacteriocin/lantibiotic exporter with double-glycine peptidase domain